jgi:phospholipid transport system transporter-binding protein
MAGSEAVTIDLGGVTRMDSAGLALLLEFLRAVPARQGKAEFINIPEQSLELIRVSGLEAVFLKESR